MTALGYYTRRKVSIGYCAQIAGMTEGEFLVIIDDYAAGKTAEYLGLKLTGTGQGG